MQQAEGERGLGFRFLIGLGLAAAALIPGCSSSSDDGCSTGASCSNFSDCGTEARCVGTQCTKLSCVKDGDACGLNNAVCESGNCSSPPNAPSQCVSGLVANGWSCEDPSECASRNCNNAVCSAPGSTAVGAACEADSDCVSNAFCRRAPCSSATGLCSQSLGDGENCCAGAQCKSGLLCRPMNCSAGAGLTCAAPSASGATCCTTTDCKAGLTCEAVSIFLKECH